jgi:excisionase family DNA binding protein
MNATVTREVVQTHREVVIEQVAYTVQQTAANLGISDYAVRRLIANGELPARNTNQGRGQGRYIVTGAAQIAYLDAPPAAIARLGIHDHRQVIDPLVKYSVPDMCRLLGIARTTALMLLDTGKVRSHQLERWHPRKIPGSALIEFLDGRDEPMHHKHSA